MNKKNGVTGGQNIRFRICQLPALPVSCINPSVSEVGNERMTNVSLEFARLHP